MQHICGCSHRRACQWRSALQSVEDVLHITVALIEMAFGGLRKNLADEHWFGILLDADAVKLDDVAIVVQSCARTCSISLQDPSMWSEVGPKSETLCLNEGYWTADT